MLHALLTAVPARIAGAHPQEHKSEFDLVLPDLRSVVGSNRASLAVSVRGTTLQVLLTLDNLIKGGAGQALQCMNLVLGFPETLGLSRAGLGVS